MGGQGATPARLAMVAGEPSGDLLASLLLRGLEARLPGSDVWGIGGPKMVAEGFRLTESMDPLSVHGYWDAIRSLREIFAVRSRLLKAVAADRPDAFIGVDAPDFNFGVEERLRRQGIKTIHFVSPSIWAWRGERITRIGRAVDLMLCMFPMEPPIYQRAGIPCAYVGHPLADEIPLVPDRLAARARLGLPANAELLAVLPGSRRGEVERIGPDFIAAARWLHAREPGIRFVVPMANARLCAMFEALPGAVGELPITIVDGKSHDVIEASDAVLVASGTASLECALYKKPMVISYRVAALTALIMRRMGYLPWVGLPNILENESLVPELLQEAATPEALGAAALTALRDADLRAKLEERFTALHQRLRCDTGSRAAEAIAACLGR